MYIRLTHANELIELSLQILEWVYQTLLETLDPITVARSADFYLCLGMRFGRDLSDIWFLCSQYRLT